MIAEIHKNGHGSFIFYKFKTPNGKNLDLCLNIHISQKILSKGWQILQRLMFKFGYVTTFFGHALKNWKKFGEFSLNLESLRQHQTVTVNEIAMENKRA